MEIKTKYEIDEILYKPDGRDKFKIGQYKIIGFVYDSYNKLRYAVKQLNAKENYNSDARNYTEEEINKRLDILS